jgi:hypothetical protein
MAEAQHDFWGTLSVVALAIVGVATLAVIVSNNSNTVNVVTATGSAFSNALGMALSPITGSSSAGSSFPIA